MRQNHRRSALLPLLLFFLLLAPAAFASCESERLKYCSGETSDAESLSCLLKQMRNLSDECRQDLQRIVEARSQASESGGGALTAFGGPNAFGPPVALASYEGLFYPGDRGATERMQNRFAVSVPIYQEGGDSFAVSLNGSKNDFERDVVLDSGRTLSRDWTRAELGVQYSRRTADLKSWSVKLAAGYAGDDPSKFPSDGSYSAVGTYGFPGEGTNYWVLLVFLSNNNQIANYVPIPGFLYIHRTKTFTGMFGFPVISMQWTPVDLWVFSFSILGANAQAEVAYGDVRNVQGFLGYTFSSESYIPSTREEDHDRLFLREQRVGPGARLIIGKKLLAEAQAGWSYDRATTIGKSVFKTTHGRADLHADWFGRLTLKYAF